MKTLKDFTPEIKAKIPEYIRKYTAGIDNGERWKNFNIKDAEELINWNYNKCGYKNPVVIVAGNPYEAQLIFNFIVSNKDKYLPVLSLIYALKNNIKVEGNTLYNTLDNTLRSTLRNTLDNTLYNTLRSTLNNTLRSTLNNTLNNTLRSTLHNTLDSTLDNTLNDTLDTTLNNTLRSTLYNTLHSTLNDTLDNTLYSTLNNTLRSTLYTTLYSTLRSTLYNTLNDTLNDTLDNTLYSTLNNTLRSTLGKYNNDYLFTANIYSNVILAWFKFTIDEFKLDTSVKVDLDTWNDLYLKSGVYSAIFSEILCVVSKYPKHIHRDTQERLHNTKGQAVEWESVSPETQFNCYFIHGRHIQKSIAEVALNGELNKEVFIKEENDEVRSAWYNYLGEEGVMKLLGAKESSRFIVTHNNGEEEIITLYKTKENLNKVKNKPYAWLKRICPSTGNVYLTPTNPDFETAEESAKFHRPDWVPTTLGYYWYSRS